MMTKPGISELTVNIKVSDEFLDGYEKLEDGEEEYVNEHLLNEPVYDVGETNIIQSLDRLYELEDQGVYEKCEEPVGKSVLELLNSRDYRIVVDITGTGLEELDTHIFWFEEELLENVMVKEAYRLK